MSRDDWRRTNRLRAVRYAKRLAAGVCIDCGGDRDGELSRCRSCLVVARARQARYRAKKVPGSRIYTYLEIREAARRLLKGYVRVRLVDHPHANPSGYVSEHVAIAAAALGRALPKGAQVHHVNEHTSDNINTNLVICQDAAYHKLLHVRMRVKALGGDPNTQRWCSTHRELVSIAAMVTRLKGTPTECKACAAARSRRASAVAV